MKTHLILLAGGSGTRFGGDLPKQFLLHDGTPLFVHALTSFQHVRALDQVVVVLDDSYLSHLPNTSLKTAKPGKTRKDSVASGYRSLKAQPGDLILIHDGARPFVPKEDIEHLIAETAPVGAGVLGTPVVHTLKHVQGKSITKTVPRDNLWEVYTPQCIEYKLLGEALALETEATDDVSLVELLGKPVVIVRATGPIPKVTYKEDYEALNV